MLTKLVIRNFKRFKEAEIELGDPVVFIGPNNSGKSTALQALALWEIGVSRWNERRTAKRPGVTINRRDLIAVPAPDARLLWRELHVRKGPQKQEGGGTQNIRIDIIVEGSTDGIDWTCGMEFDYGNSESFYCRPLRLTDDKKPERMPVPDQAGLVHLAYLPPMSGLAANETRLELGAINVRIGEGRTAEVLRNLCYRIYDEQIDKWRKLKDQVSTLFGSELQDPEYITERGEITMRYRERDVELDISSSGRGLQQTLMLLAYMYDHPGAVLLLDEPDAHLEVLRQRQIYQLLTEVARENGNQLIAASHSEVLLNEAAGRDVVVAFVGRPHRIDDRSNQVLKSLKIIGFEHYYQAEQTGWVLYLEGSTDLAILQSFARTLGLSTAVKALDKPFVHYVSNDTSAVQSHFFGIKEAVPALQGVALFDRLPRGLPTDMGVKALMWSRREIENYLCLPEALLNYASSEALPGSPGPLFESSTSDVRVKAMEETIGEIAAAMEKLDKGSPWNAETKVSDDFLVPLFKEYYSRLKSYNSMAKKNFHGLARYVPKELIDPEVKEKLLAIVEVAELAVPGEAWLARP
ncbi:MAG: AAA family ATPase [Deltaproteobacteria bacterium]|nr:AAA family ATPase [Deltaproteobacteria bacterium]